MTIVLITGFLFAIISLMFIYERKQKIKRIRIWIREHYGKKPVKKDYDWEKINYYWKAYGESIRSNEKIDEITWNDLEMNKIFSRINNCNSFAGEQILYASLHRLATDNKELSCNSSFT